MSISDELRDLAVSEFRKSEVQALERMQAQEWKSATVQVSFFLNGVMDSAIYDVKQRRFTELRVRVANDVQGRLPTWGYKSENEIKTGEAVYCDSFDVVTIPL